MPETFAVRPNECSGAVHHMLGSSDCQTERYGRAAELYAAALPAFRSVGDRYWEAVVLHNIGELEHDRGDPAAAVPHFAAAERILVELQSKLAAETTAWLRRLECTLEPAASRVRFAPAPSRSTRCPVLD